jgi:uncharacterized protein YkwD
MNWVDLALGLIVLISIIAGWRRGFLRGSLALLCWVGSLIAGYVLYPQTAGVISRVVNFGVWLLPVAFILTTVFARLLIGVVVGLITRTIPEHANHTTVNRLFGIIPGAINGWIYAVIASALLLALPLKQSINEQTRKSRFAPALAMQSEWANKKLAPVFDQAVRHTMNSLTVHPRSDERVELNFTYDNPVPRPELESQMLALVNKERRKAGLSPLSADPEMTRVARAHSSDMFARGYFAHESPEGKDPFDRMKDAHVKFLTAGENLALAQTLEIAHTNLMNSPGHRANILNPAYGRLGIGVMDGGFYGLMISQEFRD